MGGVHGRYLSVDLGNPTPEFETISPEVQRLHLGGVGLGTWLLLREAPQGAYDPLDPEAPLVFAFAPLTGSALNTSAKAAVLCKSPLTGRLNDALISSNFALSGKATGSDAMVIKGACERWSTLFIEPDNVQVRETPQLCGQSADEATSAIRAEWGDDWDVIAIGVAGENLVPFATLTHDGRHAGRGGSGAVLGAKRLKAVAVRGDRETSVADPGTLARLQDELKTASLGPGTEKYRNTGTLGNLLVFNRIGILPTENFRAVGHEDAQGLSAEGLFEEGRVQRTTCAHCMIGCEKRFVGKNGETTRMEYENVFALGSLLGIYDVDTVLAASQLCDRLGLDTISTGGTLAFAMECVERGLLEPGLLDQPGLRFGDGDMLLEVIPLIARREGVGALLALGSRALADKLGGSSQDFAPHVKGMEIPGYHPVGVQSLALGMAVGSRGADHNKSGAYDLDLSGEVDRFSLDTGRVETMVELEDQAALIDSLILCKFVRRAIGNLYDDGAAMLTAVMGGSFTADDLRTTARLIHNLRKDFNQRQGWCMEEDTLPKRFFQPTGNGIPESERPTGIDPEAFRLARGRYYALRGWDDLGRLKALPPVAGALG